MSPFEDTVEGSSKNGRSEPVLLSELRKFIKRFSNSKKTVTADGKVRRRYIRQEKIAPAFWTIAGVISLFINLVLIVVLILMGDYIFKLKNVIQDQLIFGLYSNFALMDQASIKTTIPIETVIPAKFDLPLETDTIVTLTENTFIKGATVNLNTGGLNISNAPADIVLPANSQLPVHLKLVVPVNQKIPVSLKVNVDIPLSETQLHNPFIGLQKVVDPYYTLLRDLPNSWEEAICGKTPTAFCKVIIP